MPEFANPFSILTKKEKISEKELIRGVRLMIAAEYEAVQLYNQLAEATDNEKARKVLIDIADEEKVHAGEFLQLLKELDPKEFEHYKEGEEEVKELMEELED